MSLSVSLTGGTRLDLGVASSANLAQYRSILERVGGNSCIEDGEE